MTLRPANLKPVLTKSIGSYYDYTPSLPAAYIFAVLYTVPAIFTLYQYISLKCWFWIFMVIASLMEAAGYITRAISVNQPTVLRTSCICPVPTDLPLIHMVVPFLVQFMCIFLAPAIIAASCYMAMGRVILHVTPMKYRTIAKLWVVPRWMTPIFVGCDVIAFVIQMLGASQVGSSNPNTIKTAFMIMKIGLGVQLACFGLFIVVAARFHFVSRTFRSYWPDSEWTKFAWAINVSAMLIFVSLSLSQCSNRTRSSG